MLEWLAILGAGTMALGLVVLARLRRRSLAARGRVGRAGKSGGASVPPPLPASVPPLPGAEVRSCPVCLTEYGTRNRFCVNDGAELIEGPPAGPFSQGMICPTCRRGYAQDASFCPEDADELVPYGLYGAATSTRPPMKVDSRKICPECGERHASVHAFCGRDGTELVAVN